MSVYKETVVFFPLCPVSMCAYMCITNKKIDRGGVLPLAATTDQVQYG